MAGAHHHGTAQGLQTLDVARGVGALLGTIGGTVLDADDMVAYAAEYAVAGWEVFPLRGKVPAIRGGRGVLDATTDLNLIGAWWTKFPQANIGLRVASHVIVVDTDPRHGGDVGLEQLVERHGPLPATLTAASGRGDGGRHYYFTRPFGKLSSKHLPHGVDLKTSSGYVVAPPSVHPDTGGRYVWADESPIAPPPAWLADLLVVPPPQVGMAQMAKLTKTGGALSVFTDSTADDFSTSTSWADVLEPHGWRCTSTDPDADGAIWLHPAATSACSATVRHGCLFVYSPNTPFAVTEPGSPAGLTRFRAFAILNHGGNLSAAARALRSSL